MTLMPRKDSLDLFDDIFGGNFLSKFDTNMMRTDIRENDNSYVIDVDLPGYDKNNIKVDVTDGYLNISAKMNNEQDDSEKGKYVRRERYYGECSRSFYIGDDINDLKIMEAVKAAGGVIGAPKDAVKKVIDIADYISPHDGGDGAVRDFIEWIVYGGEQ